MTFSVGFVASSGDPKKTEWDDTVTQTGQATLQEVIESVEGRVDTLEVSPVELASLTKSFLANEEATLTLGANATSPDVAVTKEVAQVGITSNLWSVASNSSAFDRGSLKPASDLNIVSDTSATLVTGSWVEADEGKVIEANGGVAILMNFATGLLHNIAPFGVTGVVSDWDLYGLYLEDNSFKIGAASIASTSIADTTYDNLFYDGASGNTPNYDMTFAGGFLFFTRWSGDWIYKGTFGTPNDLSTISWAAVSVTGEVSNPSGTVFNPDGTKMYVGAAGGSGVTITEYDLNPGYDITARTLVQTVNIGRNSADSILLNSDGTKLYCRTFASNGAAPSRICKFTLPTPYSLTGMTLDEEWFPSPEPAYMTWAENGTKLLIQERLAPVSNIRAYTCVAPYDLTTNPTYEGIYDFGASHGGLSVDEANNKLYSFRNSGYDFFQYSVYTAAVKTAAGAYYALLTNAGGSMDTTYWSDINSSAAVDGTPGTSVAYYAYSTDGKTTFKVIKTVDGERSIVRNNAGTWEYNSNATYTLETWTAATANDIRTAISDAMAVAANNMDAAQLAAVGDAEHLVLANSLDMAVVLRTDGTEQPFFTSLTLNYDANVRNEVADVGVDFVYDQPALDKIRVQSLKTQNLKIRVS